MSIQVVLCGYYGMGNGGDEALLASLLQMLPATVTPIVLSGNPSETSQRYGVTAVPRKSFNAVWTALRQSQAFIWGGGSLMQDATSRANPLYYGGLMKLAQWMGLKTIAWAQGIGPLNHSTSRWITRWALQACDGVSVRDAGSAQYLTRWKIDYIEAPDPVWGLTADEASKQRSGANTQLPAPRVAVALRSHPDLTAERLKILAKGLQEFQQIAQASIVLIPFQPSKDFAIATQLAAHLTGPHEILQIENPKQLKAVFQTMTLTIGMRFHALVMAAAEGCNSFAISYDPKVSQLMKALDLPGWTLTPHDHLPLIPETAKEVAQTWLDQYQNQTTRPLQYRQSQRSQALSHQDLLHQILLASP